MYSRRPQIPISVTGQHLFEWVDPFWSCMGRIFSGRTTYPGEVELTITSRWHLTSFGWWSHPANDSMSGPPPLLQRSLPLREKLRPDTEGRNRVGNDKQKQGQHATSPDDGGTSGSASPMPASGQEADVSRPVYTSYGNSASGQPKQHRLRPPHLRKPNPRAPAFVPINLVPHPAHIHAGTFLPSQPLRSVQGHGRSPSSRIDKHYRFASYVQAPSGSQQDKLAQHGPKKRQHDRKQPSRATDKFSDQTSRRYESRSSADPYEPCRQEASRRSLIPADLDSFYIESAARNDSHRTPRQSASPPPAPTPTQSYIDQTVGSITTLPSPQPLLVILDLNGTLIFRNRKRQPGAFHSRPGAEDFLKYVFSNYTVMIYSSARPETIEKILSSLLTQAQLNQLAAVWGRDKLGLTKAQYKEKVQVSSF